MHQQCGTLCKYSLSHTTQLSVRKVAIPFWTKRQEHSALLSWTNSWKCLNKCCCVPPSAATLGKPIAPRRALTINDLVTEATALHFHIHGNQYIHSWSNFVVCDGEKTWSLGHMHRSQLSSVETEGLFPLLSVRNRAGWGLTLAHSPLGIHLSSN